MLLQAMLFVLPLLLSVLWVALYICAIVDGKFWLQLRVLHRHTISQSYIEGIMGFLAFCCTVLCCVVLHYILPHIDYIGIYGYSFNFALVNVYVLQKVQRQYWYIMLTTNNDSITVGQSEIGGWLGLWCSRERERECLVICKFFLPISFFLNAFRQNTFTK